MPTSNAEKATGAAIAAGDLPSGSAWPPIDFVNNTPVTNSASLKATRLFLWRWIRDAVEEQQEALRQRIERADPDDIHLAADVDTWSKLVHALCDLWETRRVES